MVYDDLMIRNNTVSYYNTNRSRPVTIQCINTGVGTPVDRRRSTGMICPNRTLNSVRIIVPFLRMASSPVTISHQLILDIYIVMVYDDLMIRNNTVSYYNTNRSRPVTIQCINTGVGTPVDRRRSTGMICPNRTLNSVRIIVPFLRMASSPVTISHQLILDIYIV